MPKSIMFLVVVLAVAGCAAEPYANGDVYRDTIDTCGLLTASAAAVLADGLVGKPEVSTPPKIASDAESSRCEREFGDLPAESGRSDDRQPVAVGTPVDRLVEIWSVRYRSDESGTGSERARDEESAAREGGTSVEGEVATTAFIRRTDNGDVQFFAVDHNVVIGGGVSGVNEGSNPRGVHGDVLEVAATRVLKDAVARLRCVREKTC
jgi:hypothetical protein